MKVGARFSDLREIKQLFAKDLRVVGVGVTGFPRSALGYLLDNYSILCLLETEDLSSVRKLCKVKSLEGVENLPEKFNTSEILRLEKAREYLKESQALWLYKASGKSSRLAEEMGLKVLSTPGQVRAGFENKKQFRIEGEKAGIRIIPGETLLVDDLTKERWEKFKGEYGEKLVFQLPDYTVGGGLSTFFVMSRKDFQEFKDFVKRRREVREIKTVNVTRFIKGREASITGCATKHGVVCGVLQTQVMDQPELAALTGRSGVWLGHDWYRRFSESEQLLAEEQCRKWGEWMYKKGYKGVFGLDVIVTEEGEVWPVECNARYTGAFPVYSMMQVEKGEMPLDVWHLLEWLRVDFEMDMKAVSEVSREAKEGAHLILHNVERKFVTATKTVKAGVYKMTGLTRYTKFCRAHASPVHRRHDCARKICVPASENCRVEYVRPGFSMMDIRNENEVVLCDRTPREDWLLKPAERMGRLMLKRPVLDKKGRLLPEIQAVVKAIYDKFELSVVEGGELEES